MNQNAAASSEHDGNDVEIRTQPADAIACAFTPEVKIEFDRIGQVLAELKDRQEETKRGIELNRVAILVTAFLAFIATVLSIIILLQVI